MYLLLTTMAIMLLLAYRLYFIIVTLIVMFI